MARPKKLKSPARLNLLVDAKSKRDAFRLAFQRRISAGQLFEILVAAEKERSPEEALSRLEGDIAQ